MKNILFAIFMGSAVLALSGCGGGGDKKVVKDAAYYKEIFRKATTIKNINTEKRVLFTMRSLRDNFITKFDINGTNEGINRDIIDQFQHNLADKVDNNKSFVITDETPIILSGKKDDINTTYRLDLELKSAIATICGVDCKQQDVDRWFEQHQDALEKSAEDNSGVDQTDDSQKFLANPPPDLLLVILGPPKVPPIFQEDDPFVEIQHYREVYNQFQDEHFRLINK